MRPTNVAASRADLDRASQILRGVDVDGLVVVEERRHELGSLDKDVAQPGIAGGSVHQAEGTSLDEQRRPDRVADHGRDDRPALAIGPKQRANCGRGHRGLIAQEDDRRFGIGGHGPDPGSQRRAQAVLWPIVHDAGDTRGQRFRA